MALDAARLADHDLGRGLIRRRAVIRMEAARRGKAAEHTRARLADAFAASRVGW